MMAKVLVLRSFQAHLDRAMAVDEFVDHILELGLVESKADAHGFVVALFHPIEGLGHLQGPVHTLHEQRQMRHPVVDPLLEVYLALIADVFVLRVDLRLQHGLHVQLQVAQPVLHFALAYVVIYLFEAKRLAVLQLHHGRLLGNVAISVLHGEDGHQPAETFHEILRHLARLRRVRQENLQRLDGH